MFSPNNLPASTPTQPYRPMAVNPVAGAVMATPTATPVTASASTGIMATIGSFFTGILNFFKKLFGGTVTPAATTNVPGSDAAIAQQFGLRNDPANVAAFKTTLATVQAEPGVLGPGSPPSDAIRQLQSVLSQWGYQVPATGTFDPATADALMRFKATNGLTENFAFANGDQGVVPFIDDRTRAKMTTLLRDKQTPVAGLDHTPGNVTSLQTPISVASLPGIPPLAPPSLPPLPPPPVISALPAPALPAVPPLPTTPALPVMPALPGLPATNTATPAVGAPSADQLAACQAAGIQPTVANLGAYTAAITAIKAQPDVFGPGQPNPPEAIRELQSLLGRWGYAVQASGSFDAATQAAVTKFKLDNKLTEPTYQMADGSAGLNAFIDARTKDVIAKKANS